MFEFRLPDLGEGVAEGEILEWHVAPGDRVAEDDVLAEIETDKAAVDVPSPVDGTVAERYYEPGDVVEVGDVFVTIEEDGEPGDEATGEGAPPPESTEPTESAESTESTEGSGAEAPSEPAGSDEPATSQNGRVFAPPTVRRVARELGVDLGAVEGTGPAGRITERDVREAARGGGGADEPEAVGGEREDGDGDLKSAVRRVGEGRGGDGGPDQDDGGPKSAVRRVGERESAADTDTGGATVDRETRDRTLATPATRMIASELDVDIHAVPTDETREGEAFVAEEHVRSFAEQREEAGATGAEAESEAAPRAGRIRREAYRGIRRRIGEQMQRSRREVPHATHHDLAVVPGLVEARERLQPLAEERDVKLTYMPLILRSVAAALEEHPILNTELDLEGEEILYKHYYNVGVATATGAGLLVPVVEDVDRKGILQLAEEVNELVARARDRSIQPDEMQDGTFTVTNFGAIGGEYADPIINVPETAILGIGKLRERPVVDDEGAVVARPTLPLSLAIDHRVIDGAEAARFVNTLKEYLAAPWLAVIEE